MLAVGVASRADSGTACTVDGLRCDYTVHPPGWAEVGPVGFLVDC